MLVNQRLLLLTCTVADGNYDKLLEYDSVHNKEIAEYVVPFLDDFDLLWCTQSIIL